MDRRLICGVPGEFLHSTTLTITSDACLANCSLESRSLEEKMNSSNWSTSQSAAVRQQLQFGPVLSTCLCMRICASRLIMFDHCETGSLGRFISQSIIDLIICLSLPPGALDIFDNLLSLDPRRRLCATKVLEHPWLKKLDPSQIPALSLPMDQGSPLFHFILFFVVWFLDCHERWMRQQRSEKYRVRRLTSLNVANQSQGTDSTFNSDLDLSRL